MRTAQTRGHCSNPYWAACSCRSPYFEGTSNYTHTIKYVLMSVSFSIFPSSDSVIPPLLTVFLFCLPSTFSPSLSSSFSPSVSLTLSLYLYFSGFGAYRTQSCHCTPQSAIWSLIYHSSSSLFDRCGCFYLIGARQRWKSELVHRPCRLYTLHGE